MAVYVYEGGDVVVRKETVMGRDFTAVREDNVVTLTFKSGNMAAAYLRGEVIAMKATEQVLEWIQ